MTDATRAIELQRRLRNALVVVRSIARRTAKTAVSLDDYGVKFEGRLDVVSRVASLLAANGASSVDFEYLLAEELRAHHIDEGARLDMSGDALQLKPGAVQSIALAFHELASNAAEHGVLSRDDGRIAASWRISTGDDRRVVFDWTESGALRPTPAPRRRGFGCELIEEALPFELGATTEMLFQPAGFHCTIRLPYTDRVFEL